MHRRRILPEARGTDTSGDPRMNIGPILCGGCGKYHLPGAPCMGSITFGPAVDPLPGALPDFRLFEKSKVEQKLDRIIELLELLCQKDTGS